MSYPIDSDGWRGGPKSYRVCATCGVEKANTAFRATDRHQGKTGRSVDGTLADVCIKCQGGYGYTRKPGRPENLQHDGVQLAASRLTFDEWVERHRPTEDDLRVIYAAVERYGKKSPCPDDVIEEYVQAHPTPAKRRLWSALFHACVLLAHESNNRGRLGTYNLGSRGEGRGAQPRTRAA